jgi:hypothetical protein
VDEQGFKFLLLSNILVALGAFSLAYAAAVLEGRSTVIIFPMLSFFISMPYMLSTGSWIERASTYNDPERAAFYRRHRLFLVITGLLSILCALGLSFSIGNRVFLVMAILIILGIFYSIPLYPPGCGTSQGM